MNQPARRSRRTPGSRLQEFFDAQQPRVRRILLCRATAADRESWSTDPLLQAAIQRAYQRFAELAAGDRHSWKRFRRFHCGAWLQFIRRQATATAARRGRRQQPVSKLMIVQVALLVARAEQRFQAGAAWCRQRRRDIGSLAADDLTTNTLKEMGYDYAECQAIRQRYTARAAAEQYIFVTEGRARTAGVVKAMAAQGRARLAAHGVTLHDALDGKQK